MGFGLIFAGYASLLALRVFPMELFGFIAVTIGTKKLSIYNARLRLAYIASLLLLVFSAFDAVMWVLRVTGAVSLGAVFETALSYVHSLLLLPFHIFLSLGLRDLCASLSFEKGVKRSVFAFSICMTYYVILAVCGVVQYAGRNYPALNLCSIMLFFAVFIVFELLLRTCSRAITTDEAEEKEEKALQSFTKRFGGKKGGGAVGNAPRGKGGK